CVRSAPGSDPGDGSHHGREGCGTMAGSRVTRAERLAVAMTVLAVLHHVEHVLRFDQSGWPFRPEVTPFTYSLLIYVAIALLFTMREWPRLRVVLAAILFLVPTLAHIYVETPGDQYHIWAHSPVTNLLRVESPFLGGVAMAITFL